MLPCAHSGKPLTDNTMKKGYKTTEFWVTILTQVATIGTAVAGLLPPDRAAILVGLSQAAYAISRGLAKAGEVK